MKEERGDLQELLFLNIGILFISTSGVLGRYVTMPSTGIILFRSLVGFGVLLLFALLWKRSLKVNWKADGVRIIISALLMGGHWITYFYSLEVSNIAIALLSLFAHPAITAIIEPILLRTRPNKVDLILGFIILIGIYIMLPSEFDISNNKVLGIGLGLLSALCYSLRNIVMKDLAGRYDGIIMMVFQTGIVSFILLPYLLFNSVEATWQECLAIFGLGIATSAIGHSLYVRGLQAFSASSAAVFSSITLVWGILWGFLFLAESPSIKTLWGGAIIISVVFLGSFYNWYSISKMRSS